MIRQKTSLNLFFFLFVTFCFLLLTSNVSVVWAESPVTITSDYLEHFPDEDKYVATGNVKFEKDKTVVHADRAVFYVKAAHVEAEGHVIYEDPSTLINADRTELNTDTNTGKIYNALILLKDQKTMVKNKKIDFWINSGEVEKIDDSHFHASTATFTSCETLAETEGRYQNPDKTKVLGTDNPDWCLKGSNVDILTGNKITGDSMVYRAKGLPVLYFPYFTVPVGSDRETGLLNPMLGHTTSRGFQFSPKFFWAIDENKDATVSLDYFSKRGIGEGIEYRYLDFDDKGKWSLYHISDTLENKSFYVVKGLHSQQVGDINVSADINYVNQWDYYNQYGLTRNERIERYTQSSAEITAPFRDSRLYLLGQYWVDLQQPPQLQTPPLSPQPVPERLPELGYVVHPTNFGPLMFSMNSSISDFTRTGDVSGQRVNISPKLWHSFGDAVQIYQSISLSETAYNLSNLGTTYNSTLHRQTFEYDAYALTRFFKQYESGIHIIEPSLSFTFLPGYSHPLPLFDSVDVNNNIYYSQPAGTYALINRTALAQFSLLNTLALRGLSMSARLIQPYAFNTVAAPARALQPTQLSVGLTSGPVNLTMGEVEDFNTKKEQSATDTLSVKVTEGTTLSVSRYYALTNPVTEQYSPGISTVLSKAWTVTANMWYDQNQGGMRDFALHTIYTGQCWGLDVSFQRTPPDTIHPSVLSFMFTVSLKGFGGLKLFELSP